MYSISYGADESYTSQLNGAPVYENGIQVATKQRRLVSLYALNNSGSNVFLKLQDSTNAGVDQGKARVYPVTANSFISVALHGGLRMEKGIYLNAYTDAACTTPAGNVMHFDVNFTAYY